MTATDVTTIDHVALAVADPSRSLAFYRDVIGVEGSVTPFELGFVIDTPNGIDFTLFRGEVPRGVGECHIGVGLPSADAVRSFRSRVAAADVSEVEWSDEADYVSCKVADPDGYVVEVSWEPQAPS
jgi:catechol 2,3-dioxygenase-like lactoylglutathione lyase family enzyme